MSRTAPPGPPRTRAGAIIPLLLLLGLTPAAAAPAPPVPQFQARFNVLIDGLKVGEMERSEQRVGTDTYRLRSEMQTTGLIAFFKKERYIEQSRFLWKNGAAVPLDYTNHHNGKEIEALHFHWDQGVVKSLRNGKVSTVPIKPGTLGKLMYQVRLRHDLAAGKQQMLYHVADRGDIRDYRFKVLGKEIVKTPQGPMQTLKVARLSHDPKRKTYFWAAIKHHYIFVQLIQHTADGHTYASYLTDLQQH